jgi:hypothetical protein
MVDVADTATLEALALDCLVLSRRLENNKKTATIVIP